MSSSRFSQYLLLSKHLSSLTPKHVRSLCTLMIEEIEDSIINDFTRQCLFYSLDEISSTTLNKLIVRAENSLREQDATAKKNKSLEILSKAPLVLFPINIWTTIGGYLKIDTLTNTLTLVNRDLYRISNCLAMYKDRNDLKLQLNEKRLEAIHNNKQDLFIYSKCNTLQFACCRVYDRKYLDYFRNILNWSLSSD